MSFIPTGSLNCILCRLGTCCFGDPHFYGFNGESFDFMGLPNKYFNLISDYYIQVNALFKAWNGSNDTNLGVIGVKIGGDDKHNTYLKMNFDGTARFNGKKMNFGDKFYFPLGISNNIGYAELTNEFDGYDPKIPLIEHAGEFEGVNLIIEAGYYSFKILKSSEPVAEGSEYSPYFLNLKTELKKNDKLTPHGIIGQTAIPTEEPRVSTGTQGEGIIEGVYTDYIVDSLFSNNFKFNRFRRHQPKSGRLIL